MATSAAHPSQLTIGIAFTSTAIYMREVYRALTTFSAQIPQEYFVVPPTAARPVTPPNLATLNSSNLPQQILTAYTLLSPASKASLDVLIDKECTASSLSHWSNIPRALPFISTKMHRWSLPISNLIDDFFDSAFHVRLSLFSYESLDKLQNQPLAVQTVKVHHKDQSVYILDVSQFPLETGMRPLDWHSAWERFLEWIGRRQGLIQRRMWACHFRFLARKDHFVDNFPAILRFDIKICHLHSAATPDPSSDNSSSRSQRFNPYDRKARRDDPDDSSRNNQHPSPTCLICLRAGHKFSACTEEVTQKGQQTFLKPRDGKLV
ncbi:hypothetical protein PISMIDRAFT_7703 [Pisolithus microcarpus 441]|uniref:Uncharacterized protein n=1 Tax=Pisolithus microcarpus 441 TaxID=765257 RepID=A0A0C9YT91_9AGAM|nr:hypothetical protein PISMIDRAFT_7703 [Pisolithus microcarpus 441]